MQETFFINFRTIGRSFVQTKCQMSKCTIKQCNKLTFTDIRPEDHGGFPKAIIELGVVPLASGYEFSCNTTRHNDKYAVITKH